MSRILDPDPAVRNIALTTLPGFLAFGFGSGLSRFAPGTMGTMVAVPFALLLKSLPAHAFWPVLVALFLLGVYLCDTCSKRLGRHDPGGIVWDEMVAWWLIVAFIPQSALWWIAAFVFFRLFDILKPWPIRQVDRHVHGGFGIMLDDIVAAVFALLALQGSYWVYLKFF